MDGVMQQLPAEEKLLAQLRDSCAAGSQSSSPTSGYFEVRHHLAKCPPTPSTVPPPLGMETPMSTGVGGFAGFPQSQHQGQSPCQEERGGGS